MYRIQLIFTVVLSLVLIYVAVSEFKFKRIKTHVDEKVKTILYWTPMWGRSNFLLGMGSDIFENCTYKNCYATNKRSHVAIEKFDAIVFHGYEYTVEEYGKPERRRPQQVYIFGHRESPHMTPAAVKNFKGFYNWSMTYRLDSDVPRFHGRVIKTETDYQLPSVEDIQARPKKVAWFVSHCPTSSRREDIAKQLSKYVPVDVYGKCGNLTCGERLDKECYNFLERNYKFYLSFENAICEDYVTEKAYHVLKKNVIPLVYGGADYGKLVPPNSVINVTNFTTVKELAEYIRHLDTHTEEYLKFFEWKKHYVIDETSQLALCTLCQKLNEPIVPKTYDDIDLWWRGEKGNKCWKGFDQTFLQS